MFIKLKSHKLEQVSSSMELEIKLLQLTGNKTPA